MSTWRTFAFIVLCGRCGRHIAAGELVRVITAAGCRWKLNRCLGCSAAEGITPPREEETPR